jgi:putative flippase GtrA
VGAMNSILSILIYNLLLWFSVNYIAAYATAFFLTWLNSFYWNGKHVFKAASRRSMIRYLALYLFSFAVGSALLYLEADVFGLDETLAQFPVIAVSTVINYAGSKFWVFARRSD